MLAISVSCGHATDANSPERFPFAYAQLDCGPADGSALVFYFTMKESKGEKFEEPFISLSINENLPKSAPQDYSILQGSYAMLASRCMESEHCVATTSGILHLSKFDERNGVSGNYELHFQDGTVEKGSFDATWREVKHLMCG